MIGKSRSSRYLVENLICFWATDQYAKKLTFLWNTVEVEFLSMKVVADAIFVYHFIFRFVSCVEKFSEHLGIFLKVVNCSRFRMEIFMLPLTQTAPPHSTQLGSLAFPMSSTLFVHTKVHLLTSIRIYMYLGITSVSLVIGHQQHLRSVLSLQSCVGEGRSTCGRRHVAELASSRKTFYELFCFLLAWQGAGSPWKMWRSHYELPRNN